MRLLDLFCGAGGAAMSDVTPCLTSNDACDCLLVEVEFTGERAHRNARGSLSAEVYYLGFRELRRMVGGADLAATGATRLLSHVDQVGGLASEFQVSGIHARRIVAPMHDAHALRNRPVVNFPADTVSLQSSRSTAQLAVSGGAARRFPLPALIHAPAIDMRPKLLSDRLSVCHVSSVPEAHPHA